LDTNFVTRLILRRRQRGQKHTKRGFYTAMRLIGLLTLVFSSLAIISALIGVGLFGAVYSSYAAQLPSPGASNQVQPTPSEIFDRNETTVLYELEAPASGSNVWLELSSISVLLQQATIASQDPDFEEADTARDINRAFVNEYVLGSQTETTGIAKQLVQNIVLRTSRVEATRYERLAREWVYTHEITSNYDRGDILEWYLNTAYYGNMAYGVDAASLVYFEKSADQLSLAEAAMLAGITNDSAINPIDNFEAAKSNQEDILNLMVQQGYVTRAEAELAIDAPLQIISPDAPSEDISPQFSASVQRQLEQLVGPGIAYQGGLKVFTTLDYDLQQQVDCVLEAHLQSMNAQPMDRTDCEAAIFLSFLSSRDHDVNDGAVVVIDARSGEVLALSGEVALMGRQPGPMLQPYVYLTAFEQGYTPATMILDVRQAFEFDDGTLYVPENGDGVYQGPVSARTALANAFNVSAVAMLDLVDLDSMLRTAHAMGINTLTSSDYDLSLLSGGGEVSLIDLTYSYSVFANEGLLTGLPATEQPASPGFRTVNPTFITRIEDESGETIWEYTPGREQRTTAVVEPSLAYLITDILSDDAIHRARYGTDNPFVLNRPAAIHAGSTEADTNHWAVGYTPQIVTGIWLGNADGTPTAPLPAEVGTASLWYAIMQHINEDQPVEQWDRPIDIVAVTVCETSGLLPTAYCPTREEIFRQGTEPLTFDTLYQPFEINRETGLLATVYTPPQLIEEEVFLVLPPEAEEWVKQSGIEQPPEEFDTLEAPEPDSDLAILQPEPFGRISGIVDIVGNAGGASFQSFRLDYGIGLKPSEWIQIGDSETTSRLNSELGVWDTSGLDGLYSLRLTVIRENNTFEEFIAPVTIDNTPPEVQLVTPTEGQQYELAAEFLTIQSIAVDKIGMERVEFYVDGQLIASKTAPPYNERWIITSPGEHSVELRAYDSTGNVSSSKRVIFTVLP